MEKTELQKIMAVSGYSGLYSFVAQAKAGVIGESLATKERTLFGLSAKITTLADIAIYTDMEELPLEELFTRMREFLKEESAPSHKSSSEELKSFFSNALPDYDRDRFYFSHMKKVVEWYNILKEYATLDFASDDDVSSDE